MNKNPETIVIKAENEILSNPKKAHALASGVLAEINPKTQNLLFLRARYCICRSAWLLGEFTNALRCAGALIKVAKAYENKAFIAKGHHISGNVFIQMKSFPKALNHFFTALELLEDCHEPETQSGLLNNIGEIYSETEDYEKAREYYLKCNEISSTLSNKRNYGVSYLNLANILIKSGDSAKALEYIKKGRKILEKAGDKIGLAYSAMLEGDLEALNGNFDRAVAVLNNAKETLSSSGDEYNVMWINEKILGIYKKTDRRDDYESLAKVSLEFARSIESNEWISAFAFLLSDYYEAFDETDKAYKYFKLGHRHKAFSYDEMLVQNKRNIEMFFEIKKAEADNKVIASYNDRLEKMNDALLELSRQDSLTQIPNRRRFVEYLNDVLNVNYQTGLPVCILIIDIDHFKQYNDNYGHVNGDNILKSVAVILKSCIHRAGDFIARYGGDEFIAVLPNTDVEGSRQVIEKIINSIHNKNIPHEHSKVKPYLTLTIGGFCQVPSFDTSLESIVHKADQALYKAKEAGRDCYVLDNDAVSLNYEHTRRIEY